MNSSSDCLELIRVCEAMGQVPVFSDEYWWLKAQRNELRPACSADWLAGTEGDESRYKPVFRNAIPSDPKGRWRLIREFTEVWHGIPLGDVGGGLSEIHATEGRLGLRLPPSLREYVAYAHETAFLCKDGIHHRNDITMELKNGPAGLTVMFWNGMQRWDIPYAHLSEEDPPVFSYCAAYVDDDTMPLPVEGSGPERESLSNFVFQEAFAYKPNGGKFCVQVRDGAELRRQLEIAFPTRIAHYRTRYVAGTSIVCRVERRRGTLFEGAGILAWLDADPFRGWFGLDVWAHRSLTRGQVPGFLCEYSRQDQYPDGIFRTESEAEPLSGP